MAIRYGGILKGIMAAEAANRDDEERKSDQEKYDKDQERQDKLWVSQEEQFSETNRIRLLDMALKYANNKRESSYNSKVAADGPTIAQSLAQLNQFGIPAEAIDKVSGGTAADLAKIVKSFTTAKETHIEEYGDTSPMSNEMFVTALNEAIVTQPEGYTVDTDAILKQFGVTATDAERLLFPQNVTQRARVNLAAGSMNIIPNLSFEDLDKAVRAVGMDVVRTASGELNNLRGAPPADDPEINNWRTARIGQVEKALAKAQGDIPILTDLFSLYGNSSASNYIKSQSILQNALETGAFPQEYAEAAERPDLDLTAPVEGVENLAEYGHKVYKYLMQNNLVPLGTTVKFYTMNRDGSMGNIVEQTVTERILERFSKEQ